MNNLLSSGTPFRRLTGTICLLWLAMQPVAAAYGQPAPPPGAFFLNGKTIRVDTFNHQVHRMLAETGIPGLAVALIDQNRVVFSEVYGYRESGKGKKANRRTVFEAASLTKSFLVYVAHRLADAGKLDLDKPLCQYMPYPPLAHDSRYQSITARMVLNHSSGIENWQRLNQPDTLEIVSQPGRQFVYSGEGFQYLAKVVESILHQPYETYVREEVIKPLHLRRTYLKHTWGGRLPANYATGHDFFGKTLEKWKNPYPVPASATDLTAEDYARLIVATFDGAHLSAARIKDLTATGVTIGGEPPRALWMGAGYMVLGSERDTVVSFTGSNPGYKTWVSYSTVRKSGIVFLTNSDAGLALLGELNRLTADLDIGILLDLMDFPQYPGDVVGLMKVYGEKGAPALFARIDELNARPAGPVAFKDLNTLGWILFEHDRGVGKSLMEVNLKRHPGNAEAYYNLGQVNMRLDEYRLAYENLVKCRELNYANGNLDDEIKKCEEKINRP